MIARCYFACLAIIMPILTKVISLIPQNFISTNDDNFCIKQIMLIRKHFKYYSNFYANLLNLILHGGAIPIYNYYFCMTIHYTLWPGIVIEEMMKELNNEQYVHFEFSCVMDRNQMNGIII